MPPRHSWAGARHCRRCLVPRRCRAPAEGAAVAVAVAIVSAIAAPAATAAVAVAVVIFRGRRRGRAVAAATPLLVEVCSQFVSRRAHVLHPSQHTDGAEPRGSTATGRCRRHAGAATDTAAACLLALVPVLPSRKHASARRPPLLQLRLRVLRLLPRELQHISSLAWRGRSSRRPHVGPTTSARRVRSCVAFASLRGRDDHSLGRRRRRP